MREALAALVLLAFLAGCGDGAAPDAGTALTIDVTTDEGATPKSYELRCDPPGGNHPQAEQACTVLDRAGERIFDPVPKSTACTSVFGGPQKATVTGTYQDEKVDASFDRTNGCEIDRWDTLGTTFFDVPLQ